MLVFVRFSRRMHRLLVQQGANSTIEELLGKQHWWWDTWKENDGGVLNDNKMRDFYDHCSSKSKQEYQEAVNFIHFCMSTTLDKATVYSLWKANQTSYIEAATNGLSKSSNGTSLKGTKKRPRLNDSDIFSSGNPAEEEEENKVDIPFWMRHRCHRQNVTMTVLNPAAQSGLCGLRVIQQFHVFKTSTVKLSCGVENGVDFCRLSTNNVRRLSVDVGFKSALFGMDSVEIDGKKIILMKDSNQNLIGNNYLTTSVDSNKGLSVNGSFLAILNVDICWDTPLVGCLKATSPFICRKPIDPINEKSLVNYGPFRALYSRPFHIVYGTPSNQAVRVAIKDLAVYLGNSIFAAHGTKVKVLSDLEYRAGNYVKVANLANILFVGGPSHNKLFKTASGFSDENVATTTTPTTTTNTNFLLAVIPKDFNFANDSKSFALSDISFQALDESIIFTMPLSRNLSNSKDLPAAMAGCIHANSAEGYLHMSRLAW